MYLEQFFSFHFPPPSGKHFKFCSIIAVVNFKIPMHEDYFRPLHYRMNVSHGSTSAAKSRHNIDAYQCDYIWKPRLCPSLITPLNPSIHAFQPYILYYILSFVTRSFFGVRDTYFVIPFLVHKLHNICFSQSFFIFCVPLWRIRSMISTIIRQRLFQHAKRAVPRMSSATRKYSVCTDGNF